MGKVPHVTFVRKHRAAEPPLPDEIQVPLAEIAGRAKEGCSPSRWGSASRCWTR